jgi:hypothetical protein
MAAPETKTVHSNNSGTNWYRSENSKGKNTWTNITSGWNVNDKNRLYKTTGSGEKYYLNRSDPTFYKTTWEATNGLTKKEWNAQSASTPASAPATAGIKRTFLCNCDGPVCSCQLDRSGPNAAPSAPQIGSKYKRSRRRSTRRRRNTRSRR